MENNKTDPTTGSLDNLSFLIQGAQMQKSYIDETIPL